MGGDYVLLHFYPPIGRIEENETGEWWATNCKCAGYIDENWDAVITSHCKKHRLLDRVKWNPDYLHKYDNENENLRKKIKEIYGW
jgi:hypothetical protein